MTFMDPITAPDDPRYPARGSGIGNYPVTDPYAPIGTPGNPGGGSPYVPQGIGSGWAPQGTPLPGQQQQQQQILSEEILNQGNLYNQNLQFQLTGQQGDWENQILRFQEGNQQTNLGYDRQRLGLARQQAGVENNLSNQMYGLGVQGVHRDQQTEAALHDLRNQGFGLDEQSLGLQGKGIDLSAEGIAQAERDQRVAYGDALWNEGSRAAAAGATVSEGHRRALSTLAQQLASQLEGDRRQSQGLTLQSGQLGLDTQRLGLSRQGENVSSSSRLGALADQLTGLGYQHSADQANYGLKQQGFGIEGSQLNNQGSYLHSMLGYDTQRNNYQTMQNQLGIAQNLWNQTQGKVSFDPQSAWPNAQLPADPGVFSYNRKPQPQPQP